MTDTNADRKILALAVEGVTFTAKELAKALDFLIKAIESGLKPMEQKNYVDFQNPGGVSLLNVSASQGDVQGFTDIARQGGVNVSLKRDQAAGTFYLCLQGRQEDMLTAAKRYQNRQRGQRSRSLTAELEHEKAEAASRAASQAKTPERGANQRDSRNP